MRLAIVAGVLAGKPCNGGNAWSRMSFVLGLERLGFEVLFFENEQQPDAAMRERFESASLLVNIGGHLADESLKRAPRVRVFVDDDPGYTQFWQAAGLLGDRLAGHDRYFTFGRNIGRDSCPIPTCGIDWIPMVPPVVLDQWPVAGGRGDAFTTVAAWRGAYGRVEAGGHLYGQKAHEFRRFAELPGLAAHRFEIALQIDAADAADRDLLTRNGWHLVDPLAVAATPDDFRRYVQGSHAEFSVAQGIYVETASGWFSDRTTRYLASGRPALVQDTGFGRCREGLVTFSTVAEAVAGAERIMRDYHAHAQAARAIAVEVFDSDKVLGRMLEQAGL